MVKKQHYASVLFPCTESLAEQRKTWWHGKTAFVSFFVGVIYMTAVLVPLVFFSFQGFTIPEPGFKLLLLLIYGTFISLAPHLWFWLEAKAFFDYINIEISNGVDEKKIKYAKENFEMHQSKAKDFWLAVFALYAGILLQFNVGS